MNSHYPDTIFMKYINTHIHGMPIAVEYVLYFWHEKYKIDLYLQDLRAESAVCIYASARGVGQSVLPAYKS